VLRLRQTTLDMISRAYAAFGALMASDSQIRFSPVRGILIRPKPRHGECCSTRHQSTYRGWRHREKKCNPLAAAVAAMRQQ